MLRERSGGKPVGIKLCVGHPWELFAICKAMLKSGIRLDFIVVDGAEGGTGAAPEEFSDHVGMALREGLVMTRNALVGTGLREEVKIAAAGKVYSALVQPDPIDASACLRRVWRAEQLRILARRIATHILMCTRTTSS